MALEHRGGRVPTLGPCICVPVRLSLPPVLSSGHLLTSPSRGMLGSHGDLKPSSCLVDGWRQVKLSGTQVRPDVQNARQEDDGPVRSPLAGRVPLAVGKVAKGLSVALCLLPSTCTGAAGGPSSGAGSTGLSGSPQATRRK